MAFSLLIPFDAAQASDAAALARGLASTADQVVLAGDAAADVTGLRNVEVVSGCRGKGHALREGLARVAHPVTVVQDPGAAYGSGAYAALLEPILSGASDVVFATRREGGLRLPELPDRALGRLAQLVAGAGVKEPLAALRAFRTEAVRSVSLVSDGPEIDAELLVKLSAQLFRFSEVPLAQERRARIRLGDRLRQTRRLLQYATTQNDADNAHEGYNTLIRMDSAPNYNAWIGRRLREHLGARVLEVGAGIGTITRQIEAGRELLIALEVDKFYVDRLKNLFRGKPHVRPYLSDVALADWEALKAERLDTIVLSNVLEHIEDDAQAVRRFRQILVPGGKLIVLVPALQALFGSIDEAVGHFRRYSREALKTVLERNGFSIERLEWMNLVGIPGWFVNSRLLRRRAVPPLQLRLYDQVAPWLAEAEARLRVPVGMSLFAVARAEGEQR